MTRTGGGWRMLPKDFPPWQTVYWWFRRFVRLMLFRTIHGHRPDWSTASGPDREASPSGGVADSQSVKAPGAGRGAGIRRGEEDGRPQATTWWSTPTAGC